MGVGGNKETPKTQDKPNQPKKEYPAMSPLARLSDNGTLVFDGVLAYGLASGDAMIRSRPANDAGQADRLNLLVARRRRQNRREARA